MQVTVAYFGMLREIAGCEQQVEQLAEGATLQTLYDLLKRRLPALAKFDRSLAMSINYEYADLGAVLRDGDEVGLLPPVSGGKTTGSQISGGRRSFPAHHAKSSEGASKKTTTKSKGSAKVKAAEPIEQVKIVRTPLRSASLLKGFQAGEDGAIIVFDGIVRNNSRGRRTLYLEYSAYEEMAITELEKLAKASREKFDIRDVRIAHRLGRLKIGETSVLIAVASAHRAAAFDACRWIIDTLKKTVPIWKKEYFEDGAIWADGEPFPQEIQVSSGSASK